MYVVSRESVVFPHERKIKRANMAIHLLAILVCPHHLHLSSPHHAHRHPRPPGRLRPAHPVCRVQGGAGPAAGETPGQGC